MRDRTFGVFQILRRALFARQRLTNPRLGSTALIQGKIQTECNCCGLGIDRASISAGYICKRRIAVAVTTGQVDGGHVPSLVASDLLDGNFVRQAQLRDDRARFFGRFDPLFHLGWFRQGETRIVA